MITVDEYLQHSLKYDVDEGSRKIVENYNKNLIEKYPFLMPRNRWTDKVLDNYNYQYTELDAMPEGWRIAFGMDMVEEINDELIKFDYQDKYRITQIKEKYGGLRWYDFGTPIGKLSDDYEEVIWLYKDKRPQYDYNKYVLLEDYREHYISLFNKEDWGDMTQDEILNYNEDAIVHCKLYRIIDKCKIQDIIDKYEKLSYQTCITCGKPAKYITEGWISPYCENCIKDVYDSYHEISGKDIPEWEIIK